MFDTLLEDYSPINKEEKKGEKAEDEAEQPAEGQEGEKVMSSGGFRGDSGPCSIFYFLFYQFFPQQGRNKNKKINLDLFPNELKSKETRFCVSFDFYSIG